MYRSFALAIVLAVPLTDSSTTLSLLLFFLLFLVPPLLPGRHLLRLRPPRLPLFPLLSSYSSLLLHRLPRPQKPRRLWAQRRRRRRSRYRLGPSRSPRRASSRLLRLSAGSRPFPRSRLPPPPPRLRPRSRSLQRPPDRHEQLPRALRLLRDRRRELRGGAHRSGNGGGRNCGVCHGKVSRVQASAQSRVSSWQVERNEEKKRSLATRKGVDMRNRRGSRDFFRSSYSSTYFC